MWRCPRCCPKVSVGFYSYLLSDDSFPRYLLSGRVWEWPLSGVAVSQYCPAEYYQTFLSEVKYWNNTTLSPISCVVMTEMFPEPAVQLLTAGWPQSTASPHQSVTPRNQLPALSSPLSSLSTNWSPTQWLLSYYQLPISPSLTRWQVTKVIRFQEKWIFFNWNVDSNASIACFVPLAEVYLPWIIKISRVFYFLVATYPRSVSSVCVEWAG